MGEYSLKDITGKEFKSFFENYTTLEFIKSKIVKRHDLYSHETKKVIVEYLITVMYEDNKYKINFSTMDRASNGVYLIDFSTNLPKKEYPYDFDNKEVKFFTSYVGYFSEIRLRVLIYKNKGRIKTIKYILAKIRDLELVSELIKLRDELHVIKGYSNYADINKAFKKNREKRESIENNLDSHFRGMTNLRIY